MPYVRKGNKSKDWQFDTAAVTKWREEKAAELAFCNTKDVKYEEARRRKLAAESGLLEIELQKKQGEVLPKDEIEQGLTQAYLTIKQRLRTIPERIIPQLISETDERFGSEMLLNEIDDALLELSQLNYHADFTESSEETSSTHLQS